MHFRRFLQPGLIVLLAMCWARADVTTLDEPMYVEVFVRATGAAPRDEKVVGDLLRYDDAMLVVKTSKGDRELKWLDLTGSSAFVVKSRLIDKKDARQWLELARFGWSVNAKEQAKAALASAVKLDASLKAESQAILASEAGMALKSTTDGGAKTADAPKPPASSPPEAAPPSTGPANAAPGASAGGAAPDASAIASLPSAQRGGKRLGKDKLLKYQKSTPEQDAAAIAAARKVAAGVGDKLKMKFEEIQTDHFILFTDWDPREYGFLKSNLENAYALVSKQFEIPVKENVFVGKLPVFMFARQEVFKKFAREVDGFAAPAGVAGYFTSHGTTGMGHMSMWKPDVASAGGDVRAAEQQWAYVLTHEFTHAFVARYRSNEQVPRWLNEGVAEVIANSKFPKPTARTWARTMAGYGEEIEFSYLFDDDRMPGGEMYPVMMTMVETLVARDRKAFLAFFDDCKAGEDPEKALQKRFGLDYPGLLKAWRAHIMSH